jgi:hypothetical protein
MLVTSEKGLAEAGGIERGNFRNGKDLEARIAAMIVATRPGLMKPSTFG